MPLLLAGLMLAAALPARAARSPAPGFADESLRVHAHATARIEPSGEAGERLLLHTEGETLTLDVRDNALLLAALPASTRHGLSAQSRFLEGSIVGIKDSWLRLSFVDGAYSGAYFDGHELMLLDRAGALGDSLLQRSTESAQQLVVYRLRDVELPGLLDEIVTVPGYALKQAPQRIGFAEFAGHLGAVGAAKLGDGPVRQLRLTVVTDTEFGSVHGGNRDDVVASRVNIVDGIYSSQFQTRIVVGELRHLADNGTLNTTVVSGSDTLLSRFRTYMVSGAGSSIPKGGLNHLFSGKDFDGFTVGVAYVSTLCSTSFGYGINQIRAANSTTALTIAHEMGHNFGASHDGQTGSECVAQTGSWLMSPSLNGSSTFSPCSRDSIQPRINSATCFQPITAAGLIFRGGFEAQ
jgi:hypothetical protein